ncbi:MAG TPA: hypothetical protein VHE37_05610 [Nevskiaceae bacterium]|nr:hypothetical protein [Nevskiaceae bacterium]
MSEDDDRVPGLDRLPLRRAPESDLWPGIQARLKPRRQFSAPPWLAAAACAVLALAVMLRYGLHDDVPEAQSALPQVASTQLPQPRAPLHAQMRAEVRGLVRANLQVVDGADRQIRQAMNYEPDSPLLQRLLARNQEQRRGLRQLLDQT